MFFQTLRLSMAMVILPLLLLLLLPFTAAQYPVCRNSGNYRLNSTYQDNLVVLSTTLPKKAASDATLFATDTVGVAPNIVFALTLCRGDANASACEACVATAFQDALQLCPYSKDVARYDYTCMLRFSDKNFLATTDNSALAILINTTNFPTSSGSMKLLVFSILSGTAQSAAYSAMVFITSRIDVSSFPTLYCLMQCTPDMTADDCAACFQGDLQISLKYFDGQQGGRVLGTRCSMSYEAYPFFTGEPMLRLTNLAPQVPATNNTTSGSRPVTVYNAPSPPAAVPLPPPPPGPEATFRQHGM
jgi:hypothetical protein